jgi:hypothetical protein
MNYGDNGPRTQQIVSAQRASLRVAMCLTGAPRGLLDHRMAMHFVNVYSPILDSKRVHLSIFAHLEAPSGHVPAHFPLQQRVDFAVLRWHRGASFLPNWTIHSSSCEVPGFAQFFKNRECYKDVEDFEREAGLQFDWLLRARPDMEYDGQVPSDSEWLRLKRNLVLAVLAAPWAPSVAMPRLERCRLRETVRALDASTRPLLFADDNGLLVPRHSEVARRYFASATRIERHCIERASQLPLCGETYASSPECMVMESLRPSSDRRDREAQLWLGELPWTARFAFTECRPYNSSTGRPRGPEPAHCTAALISRRPFPERWKATLSLPCPLLACAPRASSFAPAHLLDVSADGETDSPNHKDAASFVGCDAQYRTLEEECQRTSRTISARRQCLLRDKIQRSQNAAPDLR